MTSESGNFDTNRELDNARLMTKIFRIGGKLALGAAVGFLGYEFLTDGIQLTDACLGGTGVATGIALLASASGASEHAGALESRQQG